ncbi:hypothetical protein QW180_23225 [Vibrio sinaloensis]|nr:hypothetical protein [Vibrio sinaloensis]
MGDFDGETFTNHNHPETVLWLDFGRDYYATQSFSDIPAEDGRRIVSTWMSNHQYSLELPTQKVPQFDGDASRTLSVSK